MQLSELSILWRWEGATHTWADSGSRSNEGRIGDPRLGAHKIRGEIRIQRTEKLIYVQPGRLILGKSQ